MSKTTLELAGMTYFQLAQLNSVFAAAAAAAHLQAYAEAIRQENCQWQ